MATALRTLWDRHYTADGICLAVVAPQDLAVTEAWVGEAFAAVRPGLHSGAGDRAARYALDVAGPEQLGMLLQASKGGRPSDRGCAARRGRRPTLLVPLLSACGCAAAVDLWVTP